MLIIFLRILYINYIYYYNITKYLSYITLINGVASPLFIRKNIYNLNSDILFIKIVKNKFTVNNSLKL